MAGKHNELIAKEGWIFFFPLVALALISFFLKFSVILTAVLGILAFYVAWFFRNPYRQIPQDPNAIVSPADGKVVGVHRMDDGRHLITIFLNIFNVHVNRTPIQGTVEEVTYTSGKFLAAYKPEASEINERNKLVIDDNGFKVEVTQIAGLIARRIICWVDQAAVLEKGQRFGLIRFGSRMDVVLPESCAVKVKVGDIIKGGSHVLAHRS